MLSVSSSQVRVGVRIRPLTRQEVDQGGKNVLNAVPPEIRLGNNRRFTYDAVFDAGVSQTALYAQVSAPLQTSFLDGYNATIMAYGQTGSGKTFTMGSEAHTDLDISETTGLIPRFMKDLFEQLQTKKGLCNYQLQASFLEVYGEDVHDLLDPKRTSLPLREDANGGIVCAGLTYRNVETAAQALQVLHEGTMNRTTAATLMNLTSSRSHAVFTATLTQVSRDDSGTQVTTTSRFTFVDLAGSERMKKTGAEGERAREGIKINEGLLALGNVINALADDERLAEGKSKKVHVPYRQSKLTRLLQDALGGNSQTLFLACVSGSDTNASETLSTLHYANRARNIKNAPTKNVDAAHSEDHRLHAYIRILTAELVKYKFGSAADNINNDDTIEDPNISHELLMRADVNDYLGRLNAMAQESTGVAPQPLMLPSSSSPSSSMNAPINAVMIDGAFNNSNNRSMIEQGDPTFLSEVNPDEEMAILNQLLELQQKDQEFDVEQKKDVQELKQVEGELVEQEAMLLQLKDSLKVYHDMKFKYERLMAEVQQLEVEKTQLAEQLEKALADPTQGCSTAIKKELEMVERSLARAQNETRKHRLLHRKAEQEAQKCRVMERKVAELKAGRVNLIKKQKEAAARHREYTEQKTREITKLKRKERATEQQMSKLQTEIQMHKRHLDKKQLYSKNLAEKLKQTETHLMKLLSMRRRELHDRTSIVSNYRRESIVVPPNAQSQLTAPTFAPQSQDLKSLQFLLDKAVADAVNQQELRGQYEDRVNEYTETMRSIVDAVQKLDTVPPAGQESLQHDETTRELEHEIEEKELRVELLASELENLQSRLREPDMITDISQLEQVKTLVADKDAPVLRTLLLHSAGKVAEIELQCRKMTQAVERKESVIDSFEREVETLNARIECLTHEMANRHSFIESGLDPAVKISGLEDEKRKLKANVQLLETEVKTLKEYESASVKEIKMLQLEVAKMKEKYAIVEVALQQSEGVEPPAAILGELQSNWEQLGTSILDRDEARRQIENCLADTCKLKLEESKRWLASTERNITELESNIRVMCESLGVDPPASKHDSVELLERLNSLRLQQKQLEPKFTSALARQNSLAEQVKSLTAAMGMNSYETLDTDLQSLLNRTQHSGDDFQTPSLLGDDFLSRCESQVSSLRLEKSKVLANNSTTQKNAFVLVSEMNLAQEEITPLVVQSIKRRCATIPSWWNDETAHAVARSVAKEGGVVRSSLLFAQHLNAFRESLESLSNARRQLSTKIRELVKRAQKTLLETVDGEMNATEAYSSFHDALFRLPLLSKQHIHACISEMKALVTGVEAMMQSEIEALTVVWEALNVSTEARGQFWGKIEESMLAIKSKPEGPLHDVVQSCSVDGEEWVLVAVKEGTQTFVQLETRLLKLQTIHEEVEKLSLRQDAKSRIISLDLEIRLLSAKLSEFEDEKCDKQRLVSKKTTSSSLLKEERFRKQMQSKFSSKLAQLAELLKTWRNVESEVFETNLLSEEIRNLLTNFDEMDTLVEKRTEFMHLRTVRSKGASKRVAEASPESSKLPPLKRQARQSSVRRGERTSEATPNTGKVARTLRSMNGKSPVVAESSNKRKTERATPPKRPKLPPSTRSYEPSNPASIFSERRAPMAPSVGAKQKASKTPSPAKKRLTLPPFGHVLDQAFPPGTKNKENKSIE